MSNIFKGDIGTKLVIELNANISEISSVVLEVVKPNGRKVTWNATVAAGEVYYIVQSGDLDQSGYYKIQPIVELTSGWKGRGTVAKIYVKEIL